MEELIDSFARTAGSIVEAVAVLTVFYGSVEAFITSAQEEITTKGKLSAVSAQLSAEHASAES